ncbi:MAG: hypothetical protein HQM09_00040 [Candidatus Riflebacteria bacterium]|nr:hypothetical protein [Candidatus Riflebacteria bacterium]
MKRVGMTLVEILVVAAILVLVLGPAWQIFRSGTKTSLQGMMQVETANEARRIMRQIHNDLKQSCFYLQPANQDVDFDLIMDQTKAAKTPPEYSFFTFPSVGAVADTVPSTGPTAPADRRASAITYRLEHGSLSGSPFYTLIREEHFQGALANSFPGGHISILSQRVNFFEIKPHRVFSSGRDQFFFWITLQLVDSYQAKGFVPTPLSKMSTRRQGVVIADFFDIVSPEFFSAIWNQPGMRRNWHTLLKTP